MDGWGQILLDMYVTLLPVIFAGVANMAFVKAPVLDWLKRPMDGGRKLADGRPLFGPNKTWKGFLGMIALGGAAMVAWGLACGSAGPLFHHNLFYRAQPNTPGFNLAVGLILGFAYVLFELPNSFLKRRLGITAGQTPPGLRGLPFMILDQTDSLFGCVLVVACFVPMTLGYYLAYVAIGGLTHIVLNLFLYSVKLKKNV